MIPETILYSAIDPGIRARTEHQNIDELADAIEDTGLIQPIILVAKTPALVAEYEAEYRCQLNPEQPWLLTAGGRRWTALGILNTEVLYHAASSVPGRPGFLVRGGESLIDQLIIESQENLNREDLDWRDQLHLMIRTWRVAERKAHLDGQNITARMFGVTLGVPYQQLEAGIRIYDHFCQQPDFYKEVTSIRGALAMYLKQQALEVARFATTANLAAPASKPEELSAQALDSVAAPDGQGRIQVSERGGESPIMQQLTADTIIPISRSFLNCNAYDFMENQEPGFCDHIICDPDYAIAADVLDAHPNNRPGIISDGIAQKSADDSLRELFRLLPLAYRSIKDHGFFVFWYNINFQERLQAACRNVGFRVQPWPLIWNKLDATGQSNAAPNHNFPKSVEFAMVCRKPATTLTRVQTSCVYTTTGKSVTKELGHAYAKPYEVWRWIYAACTQPNDITYDPFVGSGSSANAANTYGLRPMGTEIQSDVYANLMVNLQTHYHKLLGPNVKFQ